MAIKAFQSPFFAERQSYHSTDKLVDGIRRNGHPYGTESVV